MGKHIQGMETQGVTHIPTQLPPSPQVAKPATGVPATTGQPVEAPKHRGRPKGSTVQARPMDIIYAEKMNAAFRTAKLLVRRLKSLSRDKYIKESEMAKNKYVAFLATLSDRIEECQPSGETEEEALSDWTG